MAVAPSQGKARIPIVSWVRKVGSAIIAQPPFLWLILAGIATNPFAGSAAYLGLPLSPDRVFFAAGLLLLALDTVRPTLPWHIEHTLMAIVVAWVAASMMWIGTVTDSDVVYAFVDRLLMPFTLYAAAPIVFDNPRRRDLLLWTLTGIGAWLAISAFLERVAPQFVIPSFIVNPDLGNHAGRSRGPFLSAEAMGMALTICAFAAGGLAARRRGGVRVGAIAVSIACALGVVLALTRSVWVGAVVGAVGAALASGHARKILPALAAVGATGAAAIIAFFPSVITSITERGSSKLPVYDRLGSTDGGLRALGEHPWTGIGWRQYQVQSADWAWQSDAYPLNNIEIEIHNVFLSRAVELGIPIALILVAVVFCGPMRLLVCRARDDFAVWRPIGVGVMLTWLVVGLFGPLSVPFPNYAAWLVMGVAVAGTRPPLALR